jgi:hypothetical protein
MFRAHFNAEMRGERRKGKKRGLYSGYYYPVFSLMSPAIWVEEDE